VGLHMKKLIMATVKNAKAAFMVIFFSSTELRSARFNGGRKSSFTALFRSVSLIATHVVS
jgi:hypothetical protein